MAYRAHVQIFDPETQKRVTEARAAKLFHMPYGYTGTRNGREGWWVESPRKDDFVYKLHRILNVAADTVGLNVEITLTNHPSYVAATRTLGPVRYRTTFRRG